LEVPELVTITLGEESSATLLWRTAAAIGERQILPRQTISILNLRFIAEFLQHVNILFATLFSMANKEKESLGLKIEHGVEHVLFSARWLLAPFYIGLTLALFNANG
jgi:hypothetical protein